MTPDDDRHLVELVRSAGLRVTAPRLAVLRALRQRPHADTETVVRAARVAIGSISSQAVYNVLAAFVAAGLVRRIEPMGSVALYELRVGDNHHHVVCRTCGAVGDVDCAVGRRPCLTPSDAHGFVVDEAEVTYWGVCPSCQAAAAPAGSARRPRSAPSRPDDPRSGRAAGRAVREVER